MRKNLLTAFFITIFLIVGCSNNEEELPEFVEVSVETEPSTVKVNQEIKIIAKVIQGKDAVIDAEEMQFEVWKEGQTDDQHEKIDGQLDKKEKIYYLNKTFNKSGKYYVIAHVTARDMHTMPKIELEVAE